MIMQKLMQRTEAKVSLNTVYLMMMQEIQAKAESESLSKQKPTHFTKLHFHLYLCYIWEDISFLLNSGESLTTVAVSPNALTSSRTIVIFSNIAYSLISSCYPSLTLTASSTFFSPKLFSLLMAIIVSLSNE